MPNLTLTSSITQNYVTNARGRVADVALSVTLTDARPFVVSKKVGLLVDWGDGSQIESLESQTSPCTTTFSHVYSPGTFVLKLTGKNYALPLAETQVTTFDVVVDSALRRVPTLAELGLKPIIFGPILPRDEGYPNSKEWSFQSAQDSILLESSARMLLITAVGERLMQPDYGTKLPLMIFEVSEESLQDTVHEEIRRAFAAHEPRLSVTGVVVTGAGQKTIQVTISLVSRLDQRPFSVATSFVSS